MNERELTNIFNYYLSLENDFSKTSQYIEPRGQENVHSFEFSKLLILSCTEIEAVFKILCEEKEGKKCGNIREYKGAILKHFPKIVDAEVYIPRWAKQIRPFEGWDNGSLKWWKAYINVKHNRGTHFEDATYENAVHALSALYILILYLDKVFKIGLNIETSYILSDYTDKYIVDPPETPLPDFVETIAD